MRVTEAACAAVNGRAAAERLTRDSAAAITLLNIQSSFLFRENYIIKRIVLLFTAYR